MYDTWLVCTKFEAIKPYKVHVLANFCLSQGREESDRTKLSSSCCLFLWNKKAGDKTNLWKGLFEIMIACPRWESCKVEVWKFRGRGGMFEKCLLFKVLVVRESSGFFVVCLAGIWKGWCGGFRGREGWWSMSLIEEFACVWSIREGEICLCYCSLFF